MPQFKDRDGKIEVKNKIQLYALYKKPTSNIKTKIS